MAARKRKCMLCGAPVEGRATVCARCSGGAATGAARRVAEQVRDRVSGASKDEGEFVCPYCRHELTWQNLGTSETEVTIYVREKIYFCPACRAFLGVSSWHTEG